jgi:hypothetical protein
MKIEPGQFWIVGTGEESYGLVLTIAPLADGGWACYPVIEYSKFCSERDAWLPYDINPFDRQAMVLTWLDVCLDDDQLVRCFGNLDPEYFNVVMRLRCKKPLSEDERLCIGKRRTQDSPDFNEYYQWQRAQLKIWEPVSRKHLERIFAEEVDPDTGIHTST